MGPYLVLICIIVVGIGLWINNLKSPEAEAASTPDIYTSQNVHVGETYHVEQDGEIQTFEVIATHWTGFFHIRVEPPEGHELDRDYVLISGWTVALPASRLIEARHLSPELHPDLRCAPQCN